MEPDMLESGFRAMRSCFKFTYLFIYLIHSCLRYCLPPTVGKNVLENYDPTLPPTICLGHFLGLSHIAVQTFVDALVVCLPSLAMEHIPSAEEAHIPVAPQLQKAAAVSLWLYHCHVHRHPLAACASIALGVSAPIPRHALTYHCYLHP